MTPVLSGKEDGSISSNGTGVTLIVNRKRKADVLGRRISSSLSGGAIPTGATAVSAAASGAAAASATVSSGTSGRGSLVGWTSCPLCGPYSKKRFALGRGIAAHLHAVHTPWNKPSKAERRRQEKRQRHTAEHQQQQQQEKLPLARTTVTQPEELPQPIVQSAAAAAAARLDESYQPTPEQVEAWEEQVLQIINQLEKEAHAQKPVVVAADPPISDAMAPTMLKRDSTTTSNTTAGSTSNSSGVVQHRHSPPPPEKNQGRDRNGNHVPSYRDSLSPFLKAAANGDLATLQQMVTAAAAAAVKSDGDSSTRNNAIIRLLETRDRHLSTAEHWAAGEGHLECLQFLLNEKKKADEQNKNTGHGTSAMSPSSSSCANISKKVRRRDGKTCLHYAARNGRLECVQYLLDEHVNQPGQHEFKVDEVSGDGTTPFHLACWNLQLIVAKFLVQRGANPKATNEWGCSAAHWVGMARGCRDDVEHQQQEHQQQRRHRAKVREICNWMQEELCVSFVDRQKQSHCALHKAAQHCNQYFIEWLAQPKDQGGAGLTNDEKVQVGLADLGGHIPSEIWQSSGGNESFAIWMKDDLGW